MQNEWRTMRRIVFHPLAAAGILTMLMCGCAHSNDSEITPEKIMSSPEAKLNSIILSKIDIQNVFPEEAARWMTEESRRADPDRVGVTVRYRTFQINEFPRRITLKMAQATVLQVLEEICRQAQCNYLIEKGEVIILSQDFFRPRPAPLHIYGP